MRLMPEERQMELVSAVQKASDLISQGVSVNDALVKAAQDVHANENEVQRMVEAYNTAATLAHMKTSEDRSSSFEIADYEKIKAVLFPPEEQTKKSSLLFSYDSSFIPDVRYGVDEDEVIKSARDTLQTDISRRILDAFQKNVPTPKRDFQSKLSYVLRQCEHWKTKSKRHRQQADEYRKLANQALQQLVENFRSRDTDVSWEVFAKEARIVHGEQIQPYLDVIWSYGNIGSIADKKPKKSVKVSKAYINTNTQEHKLLEMLKLASELADYELQMAEHYDYRYQTDRNEVLQKSYDKNAAELEEIPEAVVSLFDRVTSLSKDLAPDLKDEAPKVQVSPSVGAESDFLNKARLHMSLHRIVKNDPVIYEHYRQNPAKVLWAVEEILRVSPQSAVKPSVMQSGMRKLLELGVADPFEMKAILQVGENRNRPSFED